MASAPQTASWLVPLRVFGVTEWELQARLGAIAVPAGASRQWQPDSAPWPCGSLVLQAQGAEAFACEADWLQWVDAHRRELAADCFGDSADLTPIVAAGEALDRAGLVLATAESCTGGLIGHWITERAGSSASFAGGVIAYANDVKVVALGVQTATLAKHGAVSEPTVREMATGALRLPGATIAVATSGVAGPGGGTPSKPVGTVHMALAARGTTAEDVVVLHRRDWFEGDRARIKRHAAATAIDWVRRYCEARMASAGVASR